MDINEIIKQAIACEVSSLESYWRFGELAAMYYDIVGAATADKDLADHTGVDRSLVSRRRRVWNDFRDIRDLGLSFGHYIAALGWGKYSKLMLRKASQENWSIVAMRKEFKIREEARKKRNAKSEPQLLGDGEFSSLPPSPTFDVPDYTPPSPAAQENSEHNEAPLISPAAQENSEHNEAPLISPVPQESSYDQARRAIHLLQSVWGDLTTEERAELFGDVVETAQQQHNKTDRGGKLFEAGFDIDEAVAKVEAMVSEADQFATTEEKRELADRCQGVVASLVAFDESEFVERWNELGSQQIRHITPGRKSKLRERLKDPWWRSNWEAAIDRLAETPNIVTGNNSRGWKANVDWFLRPDTVARILEGACENWFVDESDMAVSRATQHFLGESEVFEVQPDQVRRIGEPQGAY